MKIIKIHERDKILENPRKDFHNQHLSIVKFIVYTSLEGTFSLNIWNDAEMINFLF